MIDFEKLGENIAALVHEAVKAATDPLVGRIAVLEARKPETGEKGEPGAAGADGRDGASVTVADVADTVAASFERRFADLSMSWERQARDMAEKAIDRMPRPEPGAPGKDGRDFGDVDVDYDGRRGLTIRYVRNGEQIEQTKQMPVVIDAGFFGEGNSYEKGDGVTFGGSYWIAQKNTDRKPEIGSPDWRLAVRKGRDGKRQP